MKPMWIYQKLQEIEEKDDVVELLKLIHRVSKEVSEDQTDTKIISASKGLSIKN